MTQTNSNAMISGVSRVSRPARRAHAAPPARTAPQRTPQDDRSQQRIFSFFKKLRVGVGGLDPQGSLETEHARLPRAEPVRIESLLAEHYNALHWTCL